MLPARNHQGDVVAAERFVTLEGRDISVRVDGDAVFINGVQVIEVDIVASNGVIHVIDGVLVPEEQPAPDLIDVLTEDGRFNTLVAALNAAGLTDALRGDDSLTLFAPTDDAFAALERAEPGIIDGLLANPEALGEILLYHVTAGIQDAAAVVVTDEFVTLDGRPIRVRVDGDNVFINDIQITEVDITARNGIIHVLGGVLIPPAAPQPDLVDVLRADGRFGTLLAALQSANLLDALRGDDQLTVFAPTDDAFAQLEAARPGIIEALLLDGEALTAVLLYHVVAGRQDANAVVDAESFITLEGRPVSVRVVDGAVFINDSQVIEVDLDARNGVVHVLDSVLVPVDQAQPNLVELLVARGNFTTLLAAVEAAGLVDALTEAEGLTVFAPNDDAFRALEAAQPGILEAVLADQETLTAILNYHLLGTPSTSAELLAARVVNTLAGLPLGVAIDEAGVARIGPAELVNADLQASNGIVHEIGAVLLPPEPIQASSCDGPVEVQTTGSFVGTNAGGNGEDTRGSCGGGRAAVFAVTLDEGVLGGPSANVCFDTAGSDIDTLLYARSACDQANTEIACNDDPVPGVLQSQLSLEVRAGETYFLFADGFRGEAGVFNLSVEVGACPAVANIVQTLEALGNHNTLIQLVRRAGLV